MDTPTHETAPATDLSALAWVHDELRRSLDAAHKALRRFVKESAAVATSDVDAVDPAVLRTARVHIHQGVGALELVGLVSAATLLRASESAVQRFVGKPQGLTSAVVDDIEKASFALLDYLSRLLAGKPVSALSLFPQYRAVQEAAGSERVHPADLWQMDFQWRELPEDPAARPRAPNVETESALEQQMLAMMRSATPRTYGRMSDILAGLGAGAQHLHTATLWKMSAAVFEAQAQGLLKADVFSKRLASRLLSQLRIVADGNEHEVSERLAHDILFFCAQAESPGAGLNAPRLAAVRQAWGLIRHSPTDYTQSPLGRFDPALVAQARKRVAAAKEAWSAVAGGEMHRLSGLSEQFSLVGDSLKRLFQSGASLAAELQRAIASPQQANTPPSTALAMEVATALLYIEASLEDGEFDTPQQVERIERLAERMAQVRQGMSAPPLEPWIEELYRRVSDRQTMGSVVQELRTSLAEAEKSIDQFFRHPTQPEVLIAVPNQLASMRGVLSVLGMDQASAVLLRMRDEVDGLMAAPTGAATAPQASVFDRLAGNLGALGFLIDMLSVQPQLAKSLFRYDADAGTLEPLMGRSVEAASNWAAEPAAPAPVEPRLIEQAQMLAFSAVRQDVSLSDLTRDLERLSQEAHVADQAALTAVVSQAQVALERASGNEALANARGELSEALVDFVATSSGPVGLDEIPVPTRMPTLEHATITLDDDDDGEMRGIFLEEAAEVLAAAHEALAGLRSSPSDLGQLAGLRRAFHTLKGSSRMVGLREFGDAAWEGEQVYNTLLAAQEPATPAHIEFTGWSLDHLQGWVDDITGGRDAGRSAAEMVRAAQALKTSQAPVLESSQLAAGPLAAFAADDDSVSSEPAATFETVAPSSPIEAHEAKVSSFGDLMADPSTDPVPLDDDAIISFELDMSADVDVDADGQTSTDARGVPVADQAPWAQTDYPLMLDAFEHLATQPVPLLNDDARRAPFDAQSASGVELIEIDLSDFPESSEASASGTASLGDVGLPESDAAVDMPAVEAEAPAPGPSPIDAGDASIEQARHVPEDDPYKMVGPLRIGIPLFNIYLNEADELSRRLSTELAEWAMELHQPISENAIALAHSLAGSSATVGFTDLSQLARALEHAQTRTRAIGHGTEEEGALFSAVADEIRHLLHQFAAGFLKEPDPQLLQRLVDHELSSARRLEAVTAARESAPQVSDRTPLDTASPQDEAPPPEGDDTDGAAAMLREPESEPASSVDPVAMAPAESVESAPTPAIEPAVAPPRIEAVGMAEFKPLAAMPASGARSSANRSSVDDEDDDLDSVDAVDAELFPIFEEEALELLPQLSSQMREWVDRPDDLSRGSACMRTLHTLKGGARLAGAMRLGELAHRLETLIEQVMASEAPTAHDVDTLQTRADGLTRNFDVLRSRDAEAYAAAVSSVEQVVALPLEDVSGFSPLDIVPPAKPEANAVLDEPADATAAIDDPSFVDTDFDGAAVPADAHADTAPSLLDADLDDAFPVAPRMLVSGHAIPAELPDIDWSRFGHEVARSRNEGQPTVSHGSVRVRAPLLDRLVNQAGEVSITRSRIESEVGQIKGSLGDLSENLERLRGQLRDIELQAETQMSSRLEAAKAADQSFDPLEFDRFTRFQELTRMMAESVNDVATVQRTLQRTVDSTEDELASQARLARGLQDDLLRTRMVEFEGMSDRLYRVVRQAAKETGKQVRLDIVGGSIEVDRGVLDRMTGAFEHLLRNSVTHGIESPETRTAAGKDPIGTIVVSLTQEGNEVGVEFRDDGAGLDLERIRRKGEALGLLSPDQPHTPAEIANLIFTAGFSTAEKVTELAGRGIGMDVVRSEVNAMGGRIETATAAGQGTSFKLQVPLTTAVTQVVMLRSAKATVAVPSTLIELVRRATDAEVAEAYASGSYQFGDRAIAFFWLGALLQLSPKSVETAGRMRQVVIVRSAQQRIALHVDEVLGNQEVVVKNLGPQLARVPGLAGMTLLASGAVALIYNPVALATLYGETARAATQLALRSLTPDPAIVEAEQVNAAPLVLVVDDSLTVRRVTQRLLVREGYRVTLAKDGLDALERLQDEKPQVVLSDIEMPRMDGFDLVRNIRGDSRLSDLPVIMITSRIAQKHREYAAELGVDHYLGKPYSEEDLLALVSRYTAAQVLSQV